MANYPDMVLQLIALQDVLGGQYAELSRPKLRLLVKLEQGPVSISELAERLHISSPAVSQMIDKLSADGYVRRESFQGDQRVVAAALTELGRDVLARSLEAFRSRVRDVLSPLSERETRQLAALLEKALGVPIQ
jgi:DNA-binding MarR family transcriptional regulator